MDGLAIFGGFMLATWLRFDSTWIPMIYSRPEPLYLMYSMGAAFATLLFLVVFKALHLFVRPQIGSFPSKIPRIIKAVGLGILLTIVLAFAVKNEVDYSRGVMGIAFVTVLVFVLLERYIMFRIELHYMRHSEEKNNVLIVGVNPVAVHVMRTLQREKMLRCKVTGFLKLDKAEEQAPEIPPNLVRGTLADLEAVVGGEKVDQVILTSASPGQQRILDIILLCEKNLMTFNMVPDLFHIMTDAMDVQSLDDIPLLGVGRWPLDFFWNRVLKRGEDIVGGMVGLVLSFPLIAVAAAVIKATSPGPVFYRQERCGESGKTFTLYKLRTMSVDAEKQTGPVFTAENDPRRTGFGSWLRQHNLDELPQFWNVIAGDMSLVGPRPERPHFVEQFKEDIDRYMWRHVSKPGLTGWAQVNGLRGNTSIEERVKYDLYYLEHWSLAFDFKILLRTVFARENAY